MNRLSMMLLFLLGSKAPGNGTDSLDPLEDNDPLPAPIDGFIPWLLTLAFGLIFYKKRLARN